MSFLDRLRPKDIPSSTFNSDENCDPMQQQFNSSFGGMSAKELQTHIKALAEAQKSNPNEYTERSLEIARDTLKSKTK